MVSYYNRNRVRTVMNKMAHILAQDKAFIYNYRCLCRNLMYNLNDVR